MKITILSLHLGFGGVEKYVITLANMLSKKHDVEIISTYRTTQEPSFPLSDHVQVKYLIDDMIPNREQFKNAVKNRQFIKVLKEGLLAIRILYLKYHMNKKAVQQCDRDVLISTRSFHNTMIRKYAKKSIVKISTEHNHHNNNKKYIKKIVNSLKGFDYLIPISKDLTLFYQKALANTNTKVLYIPFCIDMPTCLENPTFEKPVYISVGRLSSEKGTFDLIRVFNEIVKKQKDAILHLVGDGTLMADVKKMVVEKQLENNVIVHGFLNKQEIDKLYCQSSIYLMTSFTESFGLVLLEAMACGIPCIAFDSAQGAHEIITDGYNGYLISDRNVDLFATKAIALSQNKEQLQKWSLNARKVLHEYGYEQTQNGWLSLIDTISK